MLSSFTQFLEPDDSVAHRLIYLIGMASDKIFALLLGVERFADDWLIKVRHLIILLFAQPRIRENQNDPVSAMEHRAQQTDAGMIGGIYRRCL